ncbi:MULTISPECIES: hypothetical protein [Haloarcula]|uniref:Uncharacterized protein n=1 Tax=Haloarcula pellucida TaxID=1427151 RepID=A0A830GJK3_9EURY|nr:MULTISPECIES: hypothetical protein [Halomicroarcula]MBX0348655.1 hypothetical protein [Halomicroarcula pellucida]MDS0278459.1 hypothetical protein [Halomicroarcula sp. S1AR25-4]GGN92373.1 hypothetical protein GCM10009030_16550 [Halomicroarcula pellucida]
MPEILQRVPEPTESDIDAGDRAESYWLADDAAYHLKLDVRKDDYTLSWVTSFSAAQFVRSVIDIDGMGKKTVQGECTIDGVTRHFEMGELVFVITVDEFPERCSYCKAKDEFEGRKVEIDWVAIDENAHIELTANRVPVAEFRDFIHTSIDSDVIGDGRVETTIKEAGSLVRSKQQLEY